MIGNSLDRLAEQLASAHSPVLAWSGGADSTLLLHLIREMKVPFNILTFHQLWTKEQSKFVLGLVEKLNLTVFFYAPVGIAYFGRYVTASYWMAGQLVNRVLDHVPADNCGLDVGQRAMKESNLQPGYPWDLTVVGTKKSDKHEAVEAFTFTDTETHKWAIPLWEWTDQEVKDTAWTRGYEIDTRPAPVGDTGSYIACMACLDTADQVYCPKVGRMIQGLKTEEPHGIRT